MRVIEIMRKAVIAPTLKAIGDRSSQPRYLASQRNDTATRAQVLKLPARQTDPPQIMDPTDDNFGAFKFVAGLDGLGEAPIG